MPPPPTPNPTPNRDNSRLVYSTDGSSAGRISPRASKSPNPPKPSKANRHPAAPARPAYPRDGTVRLHRSKSGRGGKTVTLITGLPGDEAALDALLKTLKQHVGAGGTREEDTLELQGDHREKLRAKLESLGHRVKIAGG